MNWAVPVNVESTALMVRSAPTSLTGTKRVCYLKKAPMLTERAEAESIEYGYTFQNYHSVRLC